jgi:hypothetical protein
LCGPIGGRRGIHSNARLIFELATFPSSPNRTRTRARPRTRFSITLRRDASFVLSIRVFPDHRPLLALSFKTEYEDEFEYEDDCADRLGGRRGIHSNARLIFELATFPSSPNRTRTRARPRTRFSITAEERRLVCFIDSSFPKS